MAKVVIIDDSRLSVSALQNMLQKIGHEVIGTAFDGEFGIMKVKEVKPDVVLLDFVMPGKDGLETAQGIRKIMPNVKIIMVTQNPLDEGIKSQIGALDHILKPITVNKLQAAFSKI